MKRFLLLFVAFSIGVSAFSQTLVGNVMYQFDETTLEAVVSGFGDEELATVPPTVSYEGKTYTVKRFGARAFSSGKFKSLYLEGCFDLSSVLSFPATFMVYVDPGTYDHYRSVFSKSMLSPVLGVVSVVDNVRYSFERGEGDNLLVIYEGYDVAPQPQAGYIIDVPETVTFQYKNKDAQVVEATTTYTINTIRDVNVTWNQFSLKFSASNPPSFDMSNADRIQVVYAPMDSYENYFKSQDWSDFPVYGMLSETVLDRLMVKDGVIYRLHTDMTDSDNIVMAGTVAGVAEYVDAMRVDSAVFDQVVGGNYVISSIENGAFKGTSVIEVIAVGSYGFGEDLFDDDAEAIVWVSMGDYRKCLTAVSNSPKVNVHISLNESCYAAYDGLYYQLREYYDMIEEDGDVSEVFGGYGFYLDCEYIPSDLVPGTTPGYLTREVYNIPASVSYNGYDYPVVGIMSVGEACKEIHMPSCVSHFEYNAIRGDNVAIYIEGDDFYQPMFSDNLSDNERGIAFIGVPQGMYEQYMSSMWGEMYGNFIFEKTSDDYVKHNYVKDGYDYKSVYDLYYMSKTAKLLSVEMPADAHSCYLLGSAFVEEQNTRYDVVSVADDLFKGMTYIDEVYFSNMSDSFNFSSDMFTSHTEAPDYSVKLTVPLSLYVKAVDAFTSNEAVRIVVSELKQVSVDNVLYEFKAAYDDERDIVLDKSTLVLTGSDYYLTGTMELKELYAETELEVPSEVEYAGLKFKVSGILGLPSSVVRLTVPESVETIGGNVVGNPNTIIEVLNPDATKVVLTERKLSGSNNPNASVKYVIVPVGSSDSYKSAESSWLAYADCIVENTDEGLVAYYTYSPFEMAVNLTEQTASVVGYNDPSGMYASAAVEIPANIVYGTDTLRYNIVSIADKALQSANFSTMNVKALCSVGKDVFSKDMAEGVIVYVNARSFSEFKKAFADNDKVIVKYDNLPSFELNDIVYYLVDDDTDGYYAEATYHRADDYADVENDAPATVAIPGAVTFDGSEYEVKGIRSHGFNMSTTTIVLPESVESIGYGAVTGQNVTLVLGSTTPPALNDDLLYHTRIGNEEYVASFSSIVVPEGTIDLYKNNDLWSIYSEYLKEATLSAVADEETGELTVEIDIADEDNVTVLNQLIEAGAMAGAENVIVKLTADVDMKNNSQIASTDHPFNYIFEGDGNVIRGAVQTSDTTGVFAMTGEDAVIQHVVIEGAQLSATSADDAILGDNGELYYGAIVGVNYGTINNVLFTGTFDFDSEKVPGATASIFGVNYGSVSNCAAYFEGMPDAEVHEGNKAAIVVMQNVSMGRNKGSAKKMCANGGRAKANKGLMVLGSYEYTEEEINQSFRAYSMDEFKTGEPAYWMNFDDDGYTGNYTGEWAMGTDCPVLSKLGRSVCRFAYSVEGIDVSKVNISGPGYANIRSSVTITYDKKPVSITVDGVAIDLVDDHSVEFTVPYLNGDGKNKGVVDVVISYEQSTAIESVEESVVTEKMIVCDGRSVGIRGAKGQYVTIVDMVGRPVVSAIPQSDCYSVVLPAAGIYVVSAGDMSRKVVVK